MSTKINLKTDPKIAKDYIREQIKAYAPIFPNKDWLDVEVESVYNWLAKDEEKERYTSNIRENCHIMMLHHIIPKALLEIQNSIPRAVAGAIVASKE